jgi:mannosyl-3-phosphoglycerate phosphatase
MTVAEVGQVCGLPLNSAALAKEREFDEAFLIIDSDRTGDLLAAIDSEGKHWTRGGRFYHIVGNNDKAAAVTALLDLYRVCGQPVHSIGIGDGMNDAAFLNVVDVPILIRTPWFQELQAAVPKGKVTTSRGPRGWNEAIMQLFG